MSLNSGKLLIALLLVCTSLYWGQSWLSDAHEPTDISTNEVVPVTGTASGKTTNKAVNESSAENILIQLSQNRPTQAAKYVRLGSLDDLMALVRRQ